MLYSPLAWLQVKEILVEESNVQPVHGPVTVSAAAMHGCGTALQQLQALLYCCKAAGSCSSAEAVAVGQLARTAVCGCGNATAGCPRDVLSEQAMQAVAMLKA